MAPLGRRVAAEAVGTGFLLAGIVGSGIMATRLTADVGLQLLINAVATASILVAIILSIGPISGAHLNPAVTLVDRWFGGLTSRDAAGYVAGQVAGGLVGVAAANLMFDIDVISLSTTARSGSHLWFAEVIATLGLVLVIFGVVRSGRAHSAPYVVGAYIAAAFFFTSSTSFANPAVTIGRMFSDTFAGIEPASAPAFLVAELVGVALVIPLIRFLFPDASDVADAVVVPHGK
ncbi:MAG: aquaporin [Acidimicrobiia bacterium]|nr:aquaporin [Acidimicrobiia bacterium]